MTQKMIDRALSKFVVYWKPPGHPVHGERFVTWSVDAEHDRKNRNPWPAIQRFPAQVAKNEAGKYNCILVYSKLTDQLIVKIDQNGVWHYAAKQ